MKKIKRRFSLQHHQAPNKESREACAVSLDYVANLDEGGCQFVPTYCRMERRRNSSVMKHAMKNFVGERNEAFEKIPRKKLTKVVLSTSPSGENSCVESMSFPFLVIVENNNRMLRRKSDLYLKRPYTSSFRSIKVSATEENPSKELIKTQLKDLLSRKIQAADHFILEYFNKQQQLHNYSKTQPFSTFKQPLQQDGKSRKENQSKVKKPSDILQKANQSTDFQSQLNAAIQRMENKKALNSRNETVCVPVSVHQSSPQPALVETQQQTSAKMIEQAHEANLRTPFPSNIQTPSPSFAEELIASVKKLKKRRRSAPPAVPPRISSISQKTSPIHNRIVKLTVTTGNDEDKTSKLSKEDVRKKEKGKEADAMSVTDEFAMMMKKRKMARARSDDVTNSPDVSLMRPSDVKVVRRLNNPRDSKEMTSWTVEEVGTWLKGLGLAGHVEAFNRNGICGSRLPGISKEELIGLGVRKIGDRFTIEKSVEANLRKYGK